MTGKLPHKDVVIIGLGWTGSILAHELTDEGLDVIAIERGPWRDEATDYPPNYSQDELRYRIRHELFLRPDQNTFTFRNKMNQTALPIRSWGAFMPPNGVGGGGVHWNAETWRFLPSDFALKTHLTERYGANFLPDDMTIQDWGVTWDEIEPHYDQFEYLCGTCGTAGNLQGKIQPGGNPWEGPRSRPYPNPAQKQGFGHTLWAKAAQELGYKPFPQPSGNMSQAYVNPLGVRMGPCTYCGFCEWFGCGNYSKASPQTTILPVLIRKSNFSARDNCEVMRINTDSSGKRATGVTFVDTSGKEWEQPADLVILAAYSIFNVQMLLHSKIGTPYDPVANTGVIGRNFTHQMHVERRWFLRQQNSTSIRSSPPARSACASTSSTATTSITARSASSAAAISARCRPTAGRSRRRRCRKARRAGARNGRRPSRDNYLSNLKGGSIHGSMYSYRDVYLDLDPTYKDRFGRPMLRMTIDFHDNELKAAAFMTDKYAEIVKAMGAQTVDQAPAQGPLRRHHLSDHAFERRRHHGHRSEDQRAQSLSAELGRAESVRDGRQRLPAERRLQSDRHAGALAYWSAKAIREQYLKNPGPLVHA